MIPVNEVSPKGIHRHFVGKCEGLYIRVVTVDNVGSIQLNRYLVRKNTRLDVRTVGTHRVRSKGSDNVGKEHIHRQSIGDRAYHLISNVQIYDIRLITL